jgi:hypothetical protein
MAKQNSTVLSFLAWFVGVMVSLAVGFGMTGKTLVIPYIPEVVTIIVGWIVVITTLVGVVMAILRK